MLGSKKIHTRNFDNEKNSRGLKIPPPPPSGWSVPNRCNLVQQVCINSFFVFVSFFVWQLSSSINRCQVSVEVLLALKPKYYNNIAIHQLKLLCTYTPKVYDNAQRDGMALITRILQIDLLCEGFFFFVWLFVSAR